MWSRPKYQTSFVEHAYIEPEAGWAERKGDTLEVHVTTQNPFQHRDDVAQILKLPKEAVRLVATACGGGFGGKLDLNVHPLLGLAAWLRTSRWPMSTPGRKAWRPRPSAIRHG